MEENMEKSMECKVEFVLEVYSEISGLMKTYKEMILEMEEEKFRWVMKFLEGDMINSSKEKMNEEIDKRIKHISIKYEKLKLEKVCITRLSQKGKYKKLYKYFTRKDENNNFLWKEGCIL